MERSIIHLNITDFAVAIETSLQPSLKGYPLIIAPLGAPRAVVYDMSDEAFKQGIRKGMPLARARRINRKIPILPPFFSRYETAMKALLKESSVFTPIVESGLADGHIFLDVTGSSRLFGPPADMAFKLKKTFQKTFSLTPVWSVAANKLVAKVAARAAKPTGEYIVPAGDERSFLAPQPLKLIPGFGKKDITLLNEFNLFKVKEARLLTKEQLEIPFDRKARQVYERLRGIDATPVTPSKENKGTFRADHDFPDSANKKQEVKQALYLLVEEAGRTFRKQSRECQCARIILSYSDGLQNEAAVRFKRRTCCDMLIFEQALPALYKAWRRRVCIRHMRLICDAAPAAGKQADLFGRPDKEDRQHSLTSAMDKIRQKFGNQALQTGLTLAGEKKP